MLCNGARLDLLYKVRSLNCLLKPQHLELCFPWIQDTYKRGQLRNFTNEISGVQAFMCTRVCGSPCPTLAPQTFLYYIQNTHTKLHYSSAMGLHHLTHWEVIHWELTNLYILSKINDAKDTYVNTSETTESYELEGNKFWKLRCTWALVLNVHITKAGESVLKGQHRSWLHIFNSLPEVRWLLHQSTFSTNVISNEKSDLKQQNLLFWSTFLTQLHTSIKAYSRIPQK